MLHEFLTFFASDFFKSYLLCFNFPGKPARACGFKTEKSYVKLEKTLTFVTSYCMHLADERDLLVLKLERND